MQGSVWPPLPPPQLGLRLRLGQAQVLPVLPPLKMPLHPKLLSLLLLLQLHPKMLSLLLLPLLRLQLLQLLLLQLLLLQLAEQGW